MDPSQPRQFCWTQRTPILGNNLIAKQFVAVLVFTFCLVHVIFGGIGYSVTGEIMILPWQFTLLLFGIVGGLLLFVIFVFYRNRYSFEFTLDEQGLSYVAGKYERGLNRLVTGVGVFAGSARVAGGGLIATSSERGAVRWEKIHRAFVDTRRQRIVLYRLRIPVIELYCPESLYLEILDLIQEKVAIVTWRPMGAGQEISAEIKKAESPR